MQRKSIRPRLMLTLSALLIMTMLMAGFSLYTLWQNQFLLDKVTQSTLEDTQTALNLSDGVAQIAAMAPYTASSARPFQVQNEKAQLNARASALKRDAAKLTQHDYAKELERTLVGALIVGVFKNGLALLGVDVLWQEFTVGVLIIVAVSIDQWIRRVSA